MASNVIPFPLIPANDNAGRLPPAGALALAAEPAVAFAGGRLQIVQLVDRDVIEQEIERLIALLDHIDGDRDLEPETDFCLAGDDGCGMVRGTWGSEHEDYSPVLPRYGTDQSLGPVNEAEAWRDHQRRMMGGR